MRYVNLAMQHDSSDCGLACIKMITECYCAFGLTNINLKIIEEKIAANTSLSSPILVAG
ncbi:cysteine peptidase family C39 domain-containing protein [Fulvivirga sediminis]|uniref:Peptidase C39 domain-containing protein n=1 Tax=Fulvivirga sediminis TaxID=2803949 RepID=A0A937F8J2_9BACT|nr:hypothetical protein [Fulvivirga sediminis]